MIAKCLRFAAAVVLFVAMQQSASAQTWSPTSAPVQSWASIVSSTDGSRLTVASQSGGVFMSGNAGSSWTGTNFAGRSWNSVAGSTDGTKLVAVGPSGIVYSLDSGASWAPADAATNLSWFSVCCSADGSECVAVVNHGGIFISTDFGATWVQTSAPTNEAWSSVTASADGSLLVAAIEPGLIYVSTDFGGTWTPGIAPAVSWTSLAGASDGSRLFAGSLFSGIYSSTNQGQSWLQTSAPTNETWWSVSSAADGNNLIAFGFFGGIYTSTNAGVDWAANSAPSNTVASVCISGDGSKAAAAYFSGGIYVPGAGGPPPAITNFPGAGAYQGLFYDANGIAENSSGFFSATMTLRGKFTAKLQLEGRSYSFSGQVSAIGAASNSIARTGSSPLTVTLNFPVQGDTLNGTIGTSNWTAALTANRAGYSKTVSPPQAGRKYTFAFPGTNDALVIGSGFGSATVDGIGNVSVTATLADGTKIAEKTILSKQGQWPFYAAPYSSNGVVLGWLTFTNGADSDMDGHVDWIRLPRPGAQVYADGFTNRTRVLASLYQFLTGVSVLNLSTGAVAFAQVDVGGGFANQISLNAKDKAANLSDNKMTLKLTVPTGFFGGSVNDPATGQKFLFNGAVLQRQNIGLGFFIGGSESGGATITRAQ